MPENQERKPQKRRRHTISPAEAIVARRLYLYVAQDTAWIGEHLGIGRAQVERLKRAGGWESELPKAKGERKADDIAFLAEAKAFGREVNQRALRAALAYLELHETASGKLSASMVGKDDGDTLKALKVAPSLSEVTTVGRLVTGQTTDKTALETDMAREVEALRAVLRGEDPEGLSGDEPGPVDGLPAAQPTGEDPSV